MIHRVCSVLIVVLLPLTAHAADEPLELGISGELFASYGYLQSEDASFNAFDLGRAESGLELGWGKRWGGELRIEAIRSAGPGTLGGIDGDSLVLRVKRAWAYGGWGNGWMDLQARGGLVPDPWIETIETHYGLRDLSASSGELAGFLDTSDLGAGLVVTALDESLRLSVAVTNGEGRAQSEQNEGKNTTAVLSVRPLRLTIMEAPAAFVLHGLARDGSLGAGSVRATRFGGGITFFSRPLNLGAEYIQARGVGDVSSIRSDAIGVWGTTVFRGRLGLVGRWDRIQQNHDVRDALITRITGGAFWNFLPTSDDQRFRLYVVGQFDDVGPGAAALPGSADNLDTTRVLVILSAAGRGAWRSGS